VNSDPTTDFYAPAIMGTDENDISLVFNFSSATDAPSVAYTGRKVSDVPQTMGQVTGNGLVVAGSSMATPSVGWSRGAVCAIPLNSVTRGTVWCASQYAGATAPGQTRLFALRLE
jgi:hypothetical protein